MNLSSKIFIQILADHLQKRETDLSESADWAEISQPAKANEVEGIVFYQCRKYGMVSAMQAQYAASMFYA